ncbi:hypothetical protein FACS1894142_4330 [Spirochaetia bacterium]|nr:hypothetical protein FACS1894142_4330 [Spirochaetia bacterium]
MGTKDLDESKIQLLVLKFVDEIGIVSDPIKESVIKDVTNALLVNLYPNKYPRKILVQND